MRHSVRHVSINTGNFPLCSTLNEQSTKLHGVTTHRPQSEFLPSVKSLLSVLSLSSEAFINFLEQNRGRHSSVGIATRYQLDSTGIESRWKQDIPQPSRSALGPTHPPVK
jgi:hypothetical protein